MMFDESSHSMGGGGMLNTSMRSEGGASALNTSRGEEVGRAREEWRGMSMKLSICALA